jgi:hypothetical protein
MHPSVEAPPSLPESSSLIGSNLDFPLDFVVSVVVGSLANFAPPSPDPVTVGYLFWILIFHFFLWS